MSPPAPAGHRGPLLSSTGARVILGPRLGQGGEGSVYSVRDHETLAAKLYHRPPAEEQIGKLRAMLSLRDAGLMSVSAWPLDVLSTPSGVVVGLLMPRVEGLKPVHLLYSPKDRRREFPQATWASLVHVSAALAEAFDVLHQRGHCVGDVNPNNVLVGIHDGEVKLKLIDTDSFQITSEGQRWLCRVGAPEFLPPELSGKSLVDQLRTPDTDAFGLAVLIFHVLFLGRHPHAGVALDGGTAPSIPEAIKAALFAYGSQARARGIDRPPHTPALSLVPQEIARCFEQAFAAQSAGRPSAQQWRMHLSHLHQEGLRSCSRDESHIYPQAAWGCPWCTLQDQLGHDLFTPSLTQAPFDAASIKRQLEALPALPERPVFDSPSHSASTGGGVLLGPLLCAGVSAGAVAAGLGTERLALALGGGIGGLVAMGWWWQAVRARRSLVTELSTEALQLHKHIQIFKKQWVDILQQWFGVRQRLLADLEGGFAGIQVDPQAIKDEVMAARQQALEQHLSTFRLDQLKLPALNQRRLKRLRHAGVETAADVRRDTLEGVGNIGEQLIGRLLQWRKTQEKGVRFDRRAVTETLTERARAVARSRLEGRLRDGPHHLARLREEAEAQLNALAEKWRVAQGRLDEIKHQLRALKVDRISAADEAR
ncbi:MAG: protein kinase domain-containing protein [Bradymonadia bacterium]